MAYIQTSFYSKALKGETHVEMILPIGVEYDKSIPAGEKFETLWMLHGGGGNSTEWSRFTAVELLALNHRFACVMPEVGFSHYNDIPGGEQYFTYVTEELPAFLRKHFPLSDKREDNYICGLSMGGGGAAKCAFNHPEKYGALGVFSSGPASFGYGKRPLVHKFMGPKRYDKLFGGDDKIPGSPNDTLYILRKKVEEGVEMPKIYDCCGTEDFIYPIFEQFKALAQELQLDVVFEEGKGGHTWDFWDEFLPRFVDHLPLKHRDYWENWKHIYNEKLANKRNV